MSALVKSFVCCSQPKVVLDLSPPEDVQILFKTYSANGLMDANQFRNFLVEVQCESKSEEEVNSIMKRYPSDKNLILAKVSRLGFSLDNFFGYLFSESFNPPISSTVHHDMNKPMSHYFIYTGHNSYLTGNQLNSDCSEKPIKEALLRGVRVIELDLWPNGAKDKVQVLHGRTLTAPVDFEVCISTIKEYAFVRSPYPVIITLEDHIPAPLQAQVAEIVHRILGDTLFYPDSQEVLKEFPSPESLKNRILISTKPPKEYLKTPENGKVLEVKTGGGTEADKKSQHEEPWGEELPDVTEGINEDIEKVLPRTDTGLEVEMSDEENEPPEKCTNVPPEYKRIITIRAGKPHGKSLKDSLASGDQYARRVSLSEPQLSKIAKAHGDIVLSFTQKNLLRIYPYGLRFDSSNYNPLQAWAHGAQMVAFNMQGYGRPLWLVHGLFRANGGCGYLKKPDCLLSKFSGAESNVQDLFDPLQPRPVKNTLKVKVYMGQGWSQKFSRTHFDTFSPPDFYTRVGIAGVKADTIMHKTVTKMDNWTPHWDTEFEFHLRVPELALLRIEVHEYDAAGKDDFGGQTCLPVSELRPGIRTIPLYDKKGRELAPVRLLVRFEFL